jgi:leader peptidase (prepilin peptidase) / N-methyltransferase
VVAGSTSDAPAEDPEPTFTFSPAFTRPGLPLVRRLALLPYTLLFQAIPDDPAAEEEGDEGEGAEWTLPFGPWIALAGLEVLLLTPWLQQVFGHSAFGLSLQLMFGDPR